MEEHTDVPAVETELTLDEIIVQLDAPYTGKLPEAALRAAQRRRDEIAPRLIECIERATETVRAGERPKGEAHFFALFLLTEFRCRDAWPAIVEAVSLPDDGGYELFDDAITEILPRTLAVLAGDSPELLHELAANRSLDMFVRWAALGGIIHRVRDGRMTREEAMKFLHTYLRDAITNRDEDLASMVVSELVAFAPREVFDDIVEAFRLELVNETLVDLAYVERAVAGGEEWVQHELARCTPTDIDDAVEELSRWCAFREDSVEAEDVDWNLDDYGDVALRDDWGGGFDDADEEDVPLSTTIRRDAPRIGRNDPCPCGSGKKYKKCCGRGKGLSID